MEAAENWGEWCKGVDILGKILGLSSRRWEIARAILRPKKP